MDVYRSSLVGQNTDLRKGADAHKAHRQLPHTSLHPPHRVGTRVHVQTCTLHRKGACTGPLVQNSTNPSNPRSLSCSRLKPVAGHRRLNSTIRMPRSETSCQSLSCGPALFFSQLTAGPPTLAVLNIARTSFDTNPVSPNRRPGSQAPRLDQTGPKSPSCSFQFATAVLWLGCGAKTGPATGGRSAPFQGISAGTSLDQPADRLSRRHFDNDLTATRFTWCPTCTRFTDTPRDGRPETTQA
ncbi:hypothetical protein F5144DRAFT_244528 [Chaetomium tenue]|uniref:Uncharacterized protein n=1 Tax=Chaetomium tenue TaxID=1854479 RepID=A0ACB7P9Q5_9PEZI|nr:hypothetical protein F5144DRAFT_244528 [Chaetomium globosum]